MTKNRKQDAFDSQLFKAGTNLVSTTTSNPDLKSYFFGFAIFQWQDAFWKCADEYKKYPEGKACTESTFGIQTVGDKTMTGTITNRNCGLLGGTYPVNAFEPKPIYGDIPGSLR